MQRFFRPAATSFAAILMTIALAQTGCDKSKISEPAIIASKPKDAVNVKEAQPSEITQAFVKKHNLYLYPELVLMMKVDSASASSKKITEAGGKVIYDPNLGQGDEIPYLIAELTPELVIDEKFINSLGIISLEVENPKRPFQLSSDRTPPKSSRLNVQSISPLIENRDSSYFVPIEDIGMSEFRRLQPTHSRGENTIAAIIDTGVDASHPAFGNRVVYWKDLTQEGRISLRELAPTKGVVTIEKTKMTLPESLKDSKVVFAGLLSEEALSAQMGADTTRAGQLGFDLNGNTLDKESFPIILGESSSTQQVVAYVDTNRDGKWSETEGPIYDYNEAQNNSALAQLARNQKLLVFPGRTNPRSYPLLFEKDAKGKVLDLTVGFDRNNHGTHVASMVAGNSGHIEGVAPEAQIMSLKVCSRGCSSAALMKGVLEAFYNKNGLIPDAVNISIGSQQDDEEDFYSWLLRDLSAKFGAIFVISASNEGPGYKTINRLGAFSPAVFVGASISKSVWENQRNSDPSTTTPEHTTFEFSSLGPSFSGELRPNIMAPGSAVGAYPLRSNLSGYMNGTSMSAPMTTGATLVLTGVIKATAEYQQILEARKAKIEGMRSQNPASNGSSLTSWSLFVRWLLESGAQKVAHLPSLAQGHGLISLPGSLAVLRESADLSRHNGFFQMKINGNIKDKKLYDRSIHLSALKDIDLSLLLDGELTAEDQLEILNEPLTAKLIQTEIVSPQGERTQIEGTDYFGIPKPGVESQFLTEKTILLANQSKSTFSSYRNLNVMKPGYTYIANYEIYRKGVRITSIRDVVHKPYVLDLGKIPVRMTDTGLDPAKLENWKSASFVASKVSIQAGTTHHYPLQIGHLDKALHILVNMEPGSTGTVQVTVYNSRGRSLWEGFVRRADNFKEQWTQEASIPIEWEEGEEQNGIYEIAVTASSSFWLANSKYNFWVNAEKFKSNPDLIQLSLKDPERKETFVTVINGTAEKTGLSAELESLDRAESIPAVPIAPNRWTFQLIPKPQDIAGLKGEIEINLNLDPKSQEYYSGNVVPALYVRTPGTKDEFTLVARSSGTPTSMSVTFKKVPIEKELYFALESRDFSPIGKAKKKLKPSVPVMVIYRHKDLKINSEAIQISSASKPGSDVFLIKVGVTTDPSEKVESSPANGSQKKWVGNLKIATKDNFEFSIPLEIEK